MYNVNQLTQALINSLSISKGAKFVGIRGHESASSGKVADMVVNCGTDYGNALRSDFYTVRSMLMENQRQLDDAFIIGNKQAVERLTLDSTVLAKMYESFDKRVNGKGTKAGNAQSDAYHAIAPNIRIHRSTGNIHLWGMKISEKVYEPGEYKEVNSAPATIRRRQLEKGLKSTKFKTFKIQDITAFHIAGKEFYVKDFDTKQFHTIRELAQV